VVTRALHGQWFLGGFLNVQVKKNGCQGVAMWLLGGFLQVQVKKVVAMALLCGN